MRPLSIDTNFYIVKNIELQPLFDPRQPNIPGWINIVPINFIQLEPRAQLIQVQPSISKSLSLILELLFNSLEKREGFRPLHVQKPNIVQKQNIQKQNIQKQNIQNLKVMQALQNVQNNFQNQNMPIANIAKQNAPKNNIIIPKVAQQNVAKQNPVQKNIKIQNVEKQNVAPPVVQANNILPKNLGKQAILSPKYQKINDEYRKKFKALGVIDAKVETFLKAANMGFNKLANNDVAVFNAESPLEPGKHQYIALKDQVGNVEVVVNNNQLLGKGQFGTVKKVNTLFKEQNFALKLAHQNPEAKKDVKNEFNILRELNKAGPVPGIQEIPSQMKPIEYINSNGETEVGYLGKLYDGSLSKLNSKSMPINEKLKMLSPLLNGLQHMKNLNIKHGDIKPDNILYKNDGGLKPCLADMGGAKKLGSSNLLDFVQGAHTIGYHADPIKNATIQALKNGDVQGVKEYVHRQDLFAMGLSYYQFLTGDTNLTPCYRSNKGYVTNIDSNLAYNNMRKVGMAHYDAKIVLAMMDPYTNVNVESVIKAWKSVGIA